MQYIGKLDIEKLGKYKEKIITVEIILTEERIKHIQEHHPGDYERYSIYISEIIDNPDYIVDDSKNLDTILYIKTIKENEKNIQIVFRLNTNEKEKNKQNSILTLWKMKDKTYRQLLRNKEIIWQNLDNAE